VLSYTDTRVSGVVFIVIGVHWLLIYPFPFLSVNESALLSLYDDEYE